MAEIPARGLEFETTRRYLVYDTSSGEVLIIHDILDETGYHAEKEDDGEAFARRMAAQDFENRKIGVLRLLEPSNYKPDASYRVDPASKELIELPGRKMTFRDFAASGTLEYP